ncbi:MAG: hypothetical protein WCK65_09065 [Rhodospirillaceae bacterium]
MLAGAAKPCLDGNRNAVGPHDAIDPGALALQLNICAVAVDGFACALCDALGSPFQGEAWVREAEVCSDFACGDAPGLVASLRGTVLPWTGCSTIKTVNPRKESRQLASYHILSWTEDRKTAQIRRKLYPKQVGLCRAEVVFESRRSVKRALDDIGVHAGRAPLSGTEAAELVAPLVRAAAPYIGALLQHALVAPSPDASGLDCIAALAPLLRVINPEGGRRGRPARDETRLLGYSVITSLLATQVYRVQGWDRDHPLRAALVSPHRSPRPWTMAPSTPRSRCK